jgi:L-iditol 2-dehydrogenase
VLVEVRSVGICGSDVHYFEEGRIGDFVVRAPLVLGHESSGVVVGRGERAARHPLGQRVALEPGVPCGRCRECREGHYNLCADVVFFATPPVDGALTRYVCINEDFAYALPDEISDDAGALIEPLSVGLWACRKAGVTVGSRVAVAGAGPIGAVVAMAARAAGAAEVILSDVNPVRLERAVRLGATGTVDARTGSLASEAADSNAFVDCTGIQAAIADGIRAVRPAGVAVLVGMCASPEVPLPHAAIQTREIWVTGTFRYANTYPTAIALVASGTVDLDALVDAHFDLEESLDALQASRRDPALLKPVVRVTTA